VWPNQPEPTRNQHGFQPGNKLAKGGPRPNSGRRSKSQLQTEELKRFAYRARLWDGSEKFAERFEKMALKDPRAATVLHKTFWGEDAQAQDNPAGVTIKIGFHQGHDSESIDVTAEAGAGEASGPEFRRDSFEIRIGGGNGQDRNGSSGT